MSAWCCEGAGGAQEHSHPEGSACENVLGHNFSDYVGMCLAIGLVPAH